jgi:hypothetical protein
LTDVFSVESEVAKAIANQLRAKLTGNSIAILARVAAQMGEPDRAIAALEKVLSIPGHDRLILLPLTLRCSGSIPCSIRSGMIRASKNSARKNHTDTRHVTDQRSGNVPEVTLRDHGERPRYLINLALVYALTGETKKALTLVEQGSLRRRQAEAVPPVTLTQLRSWKWDGLRTNRRFQKILARPELLAD